MRDESVPIGIFLARPEEPGSGIPLAVKDLFDTAGLTTTYGSAIFAEHVPAATAEAVARLEQAGYANVGKTNLHEFAYGTTSENPHFGNVPNPLAPGRIAGGSSGGSAAALAAGLADAAIGSDTGGSIRIPAACCGVVGFKPTFDLVPLAGCFPLAPSLDHGGPRAPAPCSCARWPTCTASSTPSRATSTARMSQRRSSCASPSPTRSTKPGCALALNTARRSTMSSPKSICCSPRRCCASPRSPARTSGSYAAG